MPVVYDDDSPKLTDDMERPAARKTKPYRGAPLTLYVSFSTIEKVKDMRANHTAILSQLLDKAVD